MKSKILFISYLFIGLQSFSQSTIGYSDFFTFGKQSGDIATTIGYSDNFIFGKQSGDIATTIGYSNNFIFGKQTNGVPPLYGYSDYFLFNTFDPQQGLIAYYPFNGNANDESGNGNDGEINGAALTTDRYCYPNSAYNFDGVDDYIRVNRSVQDDFTICGWIKTTDSPNGSQFWEGNGIFYADVPVNTDDFGASVLNGKFVFGTGNPDITIQSTTTVTTGKWIFVTAQRIESTGVIKIFVNGILEDTIATGNTNPLNAPDFIDIGGNTNENHYFTGSIDDIRIYSYALTEPEILEIYNEGSPPYTNLNGTITDNSTGNPIENAQIVLTGGCSNTYITSSNSQGYYEFYEINSGVYNIDVSKGGYIRGSTWFST